LSHLFLLDLGNVGATAEIGAFVGESLRSCATLVFVNLSGNEGLHVSIAQRNPASSPFRVASLLSGATNSLDLSGVREVGSAHAAVLAAIV
jgi:hypothetical protein